MDTESRLARLEATKISVTDASWLIGIAKAALELSSKMADTEQIIDDDSVRSSFDVGEEWSNLTVAFMGE